MDGNYGINRPFVVQDPNGSGEWLWVFGKDQTTGNIDTTIAAPSDGFSLPQSTINVVTTAGWPHAGGFYISNNDINVAVTYTGKTSTSFTGCQVAWELFPGSSTATMHTGDAVSMFATPRWSFGDYSVNDLSGWTNFTLEFYVNPGDLNAYVNSVHGAGDYLNCLFACGGSIDSATLHDSMQLFHLNSGASAGVTYLAFNLTTAVNSYQVTTSLSADHSWTPNTLNHIAISYDGAHLRMFVNGAQPDSTMTIAATGALDQKWYETIGWAQGARPGWPWTGSADLFDAAGTVLLGRWRFSHSALYTSAFTPPSPSAMVPQLDTRMYAEPLSSVPSRESLRGFTIATSHDNVYGTTLPVWLRSMLPGPTYVTGSRIEDMYFSGRALGIERTHPPRPSLARVAFSKTVNRASGSAGFLTIPA